MRTLSPLIGGAALLASLLACGDPQTPFAEEFVDTYCAEHADCDRLGRPCPVSLSSDGLVYEDCAFDEVAAESCLAGPFTCDATYPENAVVVAPESCRSVCGPVAPVAGTE